MKKLSVLGLGAVVLIAIVGIYWIVQQTGLPTAPSINTDELEFQTISRGNFGGTTEATTFVVRDSENFSKLLDETDFRRHFDVDRLFRDVILVGVFDDVHATGGHTLEITSVTKASNGWTVNVLKTAPDASCAVTQENTAPYHAIIIPNVSQYVGFDFTETTRSCNEGALASAGVPAEWKTVRDYVIGNHAISPEYFDASFEFVEIAEEDTIRDFNKETKSHFSSPGFTKVVYNLRLKDEDGREIVMEGRRITMFNGRIIDENYHPDRGSSYLKSALRGRKYRILNPSYEVAFDTSHEGAVKVLLSTKGCDINKNATLTPYLMSGHPFWSIQLEQAGYYCTVNGATGESMYNQPMMD